MTGHLRLSNYGAVKLGGRAVTAQADESTVPAVISECGRYRYALTRGDWLDGEGTVLFVMLNPSTADAYQDDPTIRRCIGFARRWGFARLTVANLYAYRATDPAELTLADDPVGPDNDEWLHRLAVNSAGAIVAWGASRYAHPERVRQVVKLLEVDAGLRDLRCLGQTKDLSPRHPLYVPRDARREVFRRYANVA